MTAPATTLPALAADLRALWRADAALIVAVAAPFLFLPAYAVQLLTPPWPVLPAERTQAALAAWLDALALWGQANAGWYLLADALGVLGAAALAVLIVDPGRPTVGEALARALPLWPRFVLASVIAAVPIGLGMWLILPGLYLQARFAAAAPALVRERPISAAAALGRSWQVTGRAGGAVFGAVAALFAVQWLALVPLVPLDTWLRAPGHANPVVLAVVEGAMAAVAALYQVGVVLLGIVAYRRLAS